MVTEKGHFKKSEDSKVIFLQILKGAVLHFYGRPNYEMRINNGGLFMNTILKKTKFEMGLLVVFVTILIMPAVLSGCGSSSDESVAKKAAQAYVDGDASAYYELLAPGYVEYMVGSDGWYKTAEEFQEEVIMDSINELKDQFADRCGENYSVAISVSNVEPIEDKETFEKVKKELVRDFNYEDGDIKDVTEVEIRFRCTGNGTGEDFLKTYYCVKENGNWYIHGPDIDVLS